MKSAVLYGVHDIRVEDKQLRNITPDEVLIQVKAAGICGTDVHIYHGQKGATEVAPPVILGHEFAGIVVAVGDDVTTVAVGDHVTVDPNVMCEKCEACRAGKPHFCNHMQATGVNFDGGFAEYCIVLEKQVFVLPKTVSFEAAAMCEPIGCCIHGIDLVDIKMNDTILVIGGGPIGMLMIQLAKLSGAGTVIVVEPVQEKRRTALALGADLAIDPGSTDIGDAMREHNIRRVDAAIECCGLEVTMANAIKYVDKGGTVMFFGLSAPDMLLPIKPFELFNKELTIKSSLVNPNTHGRAVELVAQGKINVEDIIADRIPLEQLEQFLQEPGKNGKTIVCPGLFT